MPLMGTLQELERLLRNILSFSLNSHVGVSLGWLVLIPLMSIEEMQHDDLFNVR